MPDIHLDALRQIVGAPHVIAEPGMMQTYLSEPRHLFHHAALCVVRPQTEQQIIQILDHCASAGLHIVPQGGNTGLVGGQVALKDAGKTIIMNMSALKDIGEVEPASQTILVGAGATLNQVREKVDEAELEFPLRLASGDSAQIGGLLAANAGGTQALAHGSARDLCMGVRVVLADGSVIDETQPLKKNNAGYHMSPLFIGSEGTLGIITAARLKLSAKPTSRQRLLVCLKDVEAGVTAFTALRKKLGKSLTMAELFPSDALDYQLEAGWIEPSSRPPRAPWYVLFDIDMLDDGKTETIEQSFEHFINNEIVDDVLIAQSQTQANLFLAFRENIPEVQRTQGASIKHDVSVPTHLIPQLLQRGIEQTRKWMPDIRPMPFGHMGDGNIHFNFSQPVGMDGRAFLSKWEELNQIIHPIVLELGGSIAAEHGVGQLKKHWLLQSRPEDEITTMKRLKTALDPHNIFNPGKVFDL